jgi:hypothetical protein
MVSLSHVAHIAVGLLLTTTAYCQTKGVDTYESSGGNQRGYALKILINPYDKEGWVTFRVGISGGFAGFIGDGRFLYPSLNGDLMFFRGGIGSAFPGMKRFVKSLELEAIVAYTLTVGKEDRFMDNSKRGPDVVKYPLYYFTSLCYPSLQNPFEWSASFGGNVVFLPTRKTKPEVQFVGFANLHLQHVQLSYANDGPFFFKPFADMFDRYHTGDAFISYHANEGNLFTLFEVGYHKFTGFNNGAYELSNRLGYNFVSYDNEIENFYNKSLLSFVAGNPTNHWGASFGLLNQRTLDVQHRIHLGRQFPLHLVPYDDGISPGGAFYQSYSRIGIKATQ